MAYWNYSFTHIVTTDHYNHFVLQNTSILWYHSDNSEHTDVVNLVDKWEWKEKRDISCALVSLRLRPPSSGGAA